MAGGADRGIGSKVLDTGRPLYLVLQDTADGDMGTAE